MPHQHAQIHVSLTLSYVIIIVGLFSHNRQRYFWRGGKTDKKIPLLVILKYYKLQVSPCSHQEGGRHGFVVMFIYCFIN